MVLFLGVLSRNMRKEMGVMILDLRCGHRQTTNSRCTSAPHLVKSRKIIIWGKVAKGFAHLSVIQIELIMQYLFYQS